MKKSVLILLLASALNFVMPRSAVAQEKLGVGFWTQTWYQHVENGKGNEGLNDFMLRRAYLSVKGQPTDYLSFFSHIAIDRLGQDGLSNPSVTAESAYIFMDNSTQGNSFTQLAPRDNARFFYLQAGHYFGTPIGPGNLQPYFRYEKVSVKLKTKIFLPSNLLLEYKNSSDGKSRIS